MMKISFDLKGLENLQRNIEILSAEQKVTFDKLFPASFMRKHTQFDSINDMVNKSPFKVESEEDFKNIPDKEWDDYVREKTSFQSWNEMLSKAGNEYLGKQVQEAMKKP